MTKYKKYIMIITAMAIFSTISGLYAQSGIEPYEIERVGLSGWQFLKINGSSRQTAMGGAFAAVSNSGAEAIFGNPAALTGIKNMDVLLGKVNWIADIGYQSVAIVKNFGSIGTFGISVVSVDMGDMAETINSPISGENRTEAVITGNTFTAGDMAAGLSYAKKVTDRLSIGGSVRWIREKIADVSMDNVSVDFGTLYYTGFRSLRLAMVARNFGPDDHLVGWSEEYQSEVVDIRMPIDFRVGLAMDFFEGSDMNLLTATVEGVHPNDGPEKVNVGVEYSMAGMVYLRAGYRFNYDEESFTLGGGFNYKVGNVSARINYAYVDFGLLKRVHMFSLGFSM